MAANKIYDPSFDTVSQSAHVWFAAFVVCAARGSFLAIVAVLVVFAAKEFWWDPRHESSAVAGSGARDFLFTCIGIVVGWLAWRFL